MTTQDLLNYYANLLILQYIGKPKAYATIQATVAGVIMDQLPLAVQNGFNLNPTVQTINFSAVPASGSFTVTYAEKVSNAIAWNASLSEVQSALNLLFGVGQVTVTGDILTEKQLTLSFNIQTIPLLVGIGSNSLEDPGLNPVTLTVTNNLAVGVQLDVLGKYAGVTRNGYTPQGPIALNDADFVKLIQLAIIKNNAGSSLATIVQLLNIYFNGEIFVFDQANTNPMTLVYYINTSSLSNLLELFIYEGLLPGPMGVASNIVIAGDNINQLFGFCTYATATPTDPKTVNISPMNDYENYIQTWPWLSYSNVFGGA